MIRIPNRAEAAANEHALCSGLLRARVLDRVPLERLAATYGFSVDRLRAKLAEHLATCSAAIEAPLPAPEAAPVVLPAPSPAVRIRERIMLKP